MQSQWSGLRERATAARAESRRLVARARPLAARAVVLRLTADPHAPAVARDAVAELAASGGGSLIEVDAVKTAVSEAVSNAVMHAYEPGAAGLVWVEAYVLGGMLTVLVADDGRGPRVPSPNPGLGLGFKVMIQLSDKCTVTRRGSGGTLIYMRFRLGAHRLVSSSGAWV